MDETLTPCEIAAEKGVCVQTVYRWIWSGLLTAHYPRTPKYYKYKRYTVERDDLDLFFKQTNRNV